MYTRRELFKKILSPTLAMGSNPEPELETQPVVFPPGQNILLQQDLCIAWGRGVCDRCETACPEQAFAFVGMLHPRIILSRCTLCSDCLPVCPTHAIAIRPDADIRPESGDAS